MELTEEDMAEIERAVEEFPPVGNRYHDDGMKLLDIDPRCLQVVYCSRNFFTLKSAASSVSSIAHGHLQIHNQ